MTSEERRQKNLQRLQVFTLMDDQRAGVGSRFALPRGWFGNRSRWPLAKHTTLCWKKRHIGKRRYAHERRCS